MHALRADKLTWTSRALSLTGLAISAYLAYSYLRHQAPVCSTSSGCEIVASSDYARPGGVPLPLAGVAGYLLLFITACMPGQRARTAGMLLTVAAISASAVLTYLELEVIGAVCLWCVASAVCASLHVVVNSARYVRGEPGVALPG
ncbi:MAG TPA: vitamin K epoxide reductase family protein [Solirubrobacteraceae bacterium]|nr:vitamin K epoxide reductase family protein [Solirubrobacteraceae bacterium]